MAENLGKNLKPPKFVCNLKFWRFYAFWDISFSNLKLTHGKPLCERVFSQYAIYDSEKSTNSEASEATERKKNNGVSIFGLCWIREMLGKNRAFIQNCLRKGSNNVEIISTRDYGILSKGLKSKNLPFL